MNEAVSPIKKDGPSWFSSVERASACTLKDPGFTGQEHVSRL